MNCSEADEMIGAYAVGALLPEESAALRAHIAGCAKHAAQAAEMLTIASTLAATVEPAPPPAALRARVLQAIALEPQGHAASAPRAISTAPGARPSEGRVQWSLMRNLKPAYAWSALAAAIIAGLLAWNLVLQNGEGDEARFAAMKATSVATLLASDGKSAGTALYFANERKIVLVADGIDQLDASKTYQLWSLDGGEPASLGVMRPDAYGRMTSVVPFDATAADAIAITVEPAGGSEQPTSDPVFTADLI